MLTHRRTTARTPSRLPTPPPLALDLRHAGRPVGWVRGDTIGFRGFASNAEAAHAAWVAYRALAQRLAKAGGRRPIPVDIERLTVSRRGDVDLVTAGGPPIAKVVSPGPTSLSGDSFGFELHVPAPTYESRMRAMAYLAYRAMRKSGVRWTLGARDGDRRSLRVARDARERVLDRDAVYDAALESFPASDAPSWGAIRVGPPALDVRRPVTNCPVVALATTSHQRQEARMHAIRAFIRSHLYAAHATSRATPAAPRPATPSIAAGPNSAARRRRARAFTRALVDTLRSFDPRHHGARSEWPAPVPG